MYQLIDALRKERIFVDHLNPKERAGYLTSLNNYIKRKDRIENDTINANIGDIGFFDFGQAYQHEIGYQHLGLILSKNANKVFVAPIVSKKNSWIGKNQYHLERFNYGLTQDSLVYLNDVKWINETRFINVIGHINVENPDFMNIKNQALDLIIKNF